MTKRLWLISNYNQDPTALISRLTAPHLVFNQGDPSHVPEPCRGSPAYRKSKHTGHNISDYLEFIVENYDDLPESLGFAKGNLFPRHVREEVFIKRQELEGFVPLYSDDATYDRQNHKIWSFQLVAQQIAPGYYLEIANNWYCKHRAKGKIFPKLDDLFEEFFKRKPPRYIPYVPGACMIVPAENIRRWPIEVYRRLHHAVSYDFFPVEAFHVERSMLYFFSFPKE